MNSAHVAVVIPAYNEQKNLQILLADIGVYLPHALVIIVDDSSDQEARALSRMLVDEFPRSVLISRGRKMGRGSAVVAGFAEALRHKEIRYCFEMDADLAHSPSEFDRFLALRDKADMIIGSRYIDGSRIIKWPLKRLMQSKLINASLNIWLGLHISDYTNGFRLYSRKAAEFLVHTRLVESGFIALSEIAYKLKRSGFCIAEVPISFQDRKYGKSNANLREILRSLVGVVRIRLMLQ